MRPLSLLPILALSAPAAIAERKSADASLDTILRRLVQSSRSLNIRGTQVVTSVSQNAPVATTMRVVRARDGRSLTTCVDPGADRGGVTYDDGHWRKSYDPRAHVVTVTRALPRPQDDRAVERMVRLIRRNYRVSRIGKETVAGRRCDVVALEPMPGHPIGNPMRMWIDSANGAVLWHMESNRRGDTIGVTVFTSVEYPARIGPEETAPRFPDKAGRVNLSRSPVLYDIASLRKIAGFDVCAPLSIPGGFEFEYCTMVLLDSVPTACLRYTDGVTNITICQSEARTHRPPGFRAMSGRALPMGDVMVTCAYGSMDYVVMGHGEMGGLVAVARAIDVDLERAWRNYAAHAFRVTPATISWLRDRGLCMDVIAAMLEIEERRRTGLTPLMRMHRDGWDWRQIASHFGLNTHEIALRIRRFEPH